MKKKEKILKARLKKIRIDLGPTSYIERSKIVQDHARKIGYSGKVSSNYRYLYFTECGLIGFYRGELFYNQQNDYVEMNIENFLKLKKEDVVNWEREFECFMSSLPKKDKVPVWERYLWWVNKGIPVWSTFYQKDAENNLVSLLIHLSGMKLMKDTHFGTTLVISGCIELMK